MELDVTELASNMLEAFKANLKKQWPEVKEYADSESKKLAESLVMIERLKFAGKITEEQAKLHFEIQKNASRTVLLALEGLGLIAVEQAINSAIAVLRDSVNTALGFQLL